jgi:hypothetical protein
MKDFEHLVSVWQGQPKPDRLSVDEALKQVKKGLNNLSSNVLWGIVSICAAMAAIFGLALFAVFEKGMSYIGLFTILAGLIMYLFLAVGDYRTLSRHDITANPAFYLNTLKEYQRRRANLYGRFYYIFLLIIALGVSLYTVEILEHKAMLIKILYYGFCIAYFLFFTFYVKDKIVQNEHKKVNAIIERLERLQGQFE